MNLKNLKARLAENKERAAMMKNEIVNEYDRYSLVGIRFLSSQLENLNKQIKADEELLMQLADYSELPKSRQYTLGGINARNEISNKLMDISDYLNEAVHAFVQKDENALSMFIRVQDKLEKLKYDNWDKVDKALDDLDK